MDISQFNQMTKLLEMRSPAHGFSSVPPNLEKLYTLIREQAIETQEHRQALEQMVTKCKQECQEQCRNLGNEFGQKPDFSDLEAIAHKIHTKADSANVSELFSALKKELVDQISKLKKDKSAKIKSTKKAEEIAQAAYDESTKCAEKILKLANQFDKELVDRDSKSKALQQQMWDDITGLFKDHEEDVTDLVRQVTEMQGKKVDKKDLMQQISKLQTQFNEKEKSEAGQQKFVAINTEVTQKITDLRTEMVKRFTELHQQVSDQFYCRPTND